MHVLHDAPLAAAIPLGYSLALIVAAVYMALTIIGSLVLSAARRTRDLAYLRTLGVTGRQALALTIMEHAPPVLLAVIPGVALGIGVAILCEPGLGLATFVGTDGAPLFVDWPTLDRARRRARRGRRGGRDGGHLARAPGPLGGRAPDRRRLTPDGGRMSEERAELVELPAGVQVPNDPPGQPAAPGPRPGGPGWSDGRPATVPAPVPARRALGDGALIVCDNLVKIYKVADLEVVALQGLDMLVEPGEFIALVGASGSGKSTLMNILGGLDVPSAGRAVVAGHVLGEMDRRERTPSTAAA